MKQVSGVLPEYKTDFATDHIFQFQRFLFLSRDQIETGKKNNRFREKFQQDLGSILIKTNLELSKQTGMKPMEYDQLFDSQESDVNKSYAKT